MDSFRQDGFVKPYRISGDNNLNPPNSQLIFLTLKTSKSMRPDPTRYKVWSGRVLEGRTRNGEYTANVDVTWLFSQLNTVQLLRLIGFKFVTSKLISHSLSLSQEV